MGAHEAYIEEIVEQFLAGAEYIAASKVASDRYGAGSTAVAVAIELFERHGLDMVRKFLDALEYTEECQ